MALQSVDPVAALARASSVPSDGGFRSRPARGAACFPPFRISGHGPPSLATPDSCPCPRAVIGAAERMEGNGNEIRRTQSRAGVARGAHRLRLHRAHADPGAGDSAPARRPRPDRLGADRHRQDRRVRAAGAATPRAVGHPRPRRAATASPSPSVLVLAPTRELAQQVAEQAVRYGRSLRVNTVCIYGGAPYPIQNRELARGADIIVATPGRLIDHLERGRIDLSTLEVLVLDEADRMLDMGFVDDVERIALLAPKTRQTVLFSATFDGAIARLSARLMRDAVRIDVAGGQGGAARDRAARPLCRRPLAQAPDPRSPAGRHRHHAEHRLHRDEARRRVARAAAEGRRPRRGRAARRHEPARAHAHADGHAARPRAHAGRDRRRRARHRRRRHQPCDQLRPAAAGRRLRPPDRPHRAAPARRASRCRSRTTPNAARCARSSALPAPRFRRTRFPDSSRGGASTRRASRRIRQAGVRAVPTRHRIRGPLRVGGSRRCARVVAASGTRASPSGFRGGFAKKAARARCTYFDRQYISGRQPPS